MLSPQRYLINFAPNGLKAVAGSLVACESTSKLATRGFRDLPIHCFSNDVSFGDGIFNSLPHNASMHVNLDMDLDILVIVLGDYWNWVILSNQVNCCHVSSITNRIST